MVVGSQRATSGTRSFLNNDDALSCKFDVGTSRHVGATLERWRELVRAMVGFKLIAVGSPFREAGGVSG